jgi:quercetin dioxygenase-like cupin family protein
MKISCEKFHALWMAAIVSAAVVGQAAAQGPAGSFIDPKNIKWGDAPASVPKGAKVAVLHGDPGQSGPFVMRVAVPAGYKIPPHWHSQDENLTVVSGTLYLGMGDKFEPGKAHALAAGGFHFLPGKEHHYAFAKARTVIQVNGNGPFDITYINPGDDPQKAH